jgi:hypothetical protein
VLHGRLQQLRTLVSFPKVVGGLTCASLHTLVDIWRRLIAPAYIMCERYYRRSIATCSFKGMRRDINTNSHRATITPSYDGFSGPSLQLPESITSSFATLVLACPLRIARLACRNGALYPYHWNLTKRLVEGSRTCCWRLYAAQYGDR